MVLKEVLESEVRVDRMQLEQVLEFEYLRCILYEAGTDETWCRWKVVSGRKVLGAIKSPVNGMVQQLEFARALYET